MSNIHAGFPPKEWVGSESRLVHFHNFERLSTKKGHPAMSPTFVCYNCGWYLKMCPGGDKSSSDGMISLSLTCFSPVTTTVTLVIRDVDGKTVNERSLVDCKFDGSASWVCYDFFPRSKIIDPSNKILDQGALTIEVQIKPHSDVCSNYIPENFHFFSWFHRSPLLPSFLDEETADVIFEVKGDSGNDETSGVKFCAHKVVLKFCAKDSTLALASQNSDSSAKPIPIPNIDPAVFSEALRFVYGGKLRPAEWKNRAKDLVCAADQLNLTHLKIEAEAWYVHHLDITVDNVISELSFADEKNCFLLKEVATDFILSHGHEVLASESYKNMPESKSITSEIIALASMKLKDSESKKDGNLASLSINELRYMLQYLGQDIDGPRNGLISQLKNRLRRFSNEESDESDNSNSDSDESDSESEE